MGKLNQIIAVVSGKKTKAQQTLTEAYHKIQKGNLFDGISRVYQPKDEDGEKLPSENKGIQTKVGELITEVSNSLTEMFDCVATQDFSNCLAKANVLIDDKIVVHNVPVTHLLFLEKQLIDLATFVGKLPILDPAEEWFYDKNTDCYATKPSETTRTKKIPKAFVKYEATKEHPAQVDVFTEDILVGNWKTVKFSGAIPAKEKNAMLGRVRRLQEAVVKAREIANGVEVEEVRIAKPILNYIFNGSNTA